jgi:hypothetical protein
VISRAHEIRTVVLIAALALVPAGGTVAVIALTSQPNLSEFNAVGNHVPGYSLLSWSKLLWDPRQALNAEAAALTGRPAEVLGYMMGGDRAPDKGRWVRAFVLLPEPGNLFHPAHRFGDQMIAVRLLDGTRFRFSPRTLVWVRGKLKAKSGDPAGNTPLYSLEEAYAQLAEKGEIWKYFK